jgi:DNA repair exonuclease SbcCD ATPase subunit
MKKITLKSITLRNFRGEKERTTCFHPAGETYILGGNGLGKSRHFAAFCWLLFGKDELDRKDFNVRTVDGHNEPLHRVECSVSAQLEVDGQPLAIKRALVEKWVKPRGQAEEIFKGNETECLWNDVPVSVSEYGSRVSSELVSDTVFKMVTNPLFFAGMKWSDQREQLFRLAGAITDSDMAAKNPEFAALLDRIAGKPLADFKREINAKKKRLKDELAQINPKIDQTQKLMPPPADFAALEKQLEAANKEVADIENAIADKAAATRQQGEAAQKQQAEINELKQQQQQALFTAQQKAREEVFDANAKRREAESSVKVAEAEIESLGRLIANSRRSIQSLEESVKRRAMDCDALRQKWIDENAKEYVEPDTALVCPVFNIRCFDSRATAMHAENSDKASASFYEAKQAKLAEISASGKKAKEEAEALNKERSELKEKSDELSVKLVAQEATLFTLQEQLSKTPQADEKPVSSAELPEYVALGKDIAALEAALRNMQAATTDTTDLRGRKHELLYRRDEAKAALSARDLIAKYTLEIEALEKQSKALAQQIADAEREEYAAQQLTKARVEECERRINGLFSCVTFKLFDYTLDGNEVETCVPLVGGVPFDVANTAGQVNAGLDIINALSKFHGVSAPIFIDGRESVNEIIPTESQIINLAVTKDKELIIK